MNNVYATIKTPLKQNSDTKNNSLLRVLIYSWFPLLLILPCISWVDFNIYCYTEFKHNFFLICFRDGKINGNRVLIKLSFSHFPRDLTEPQLLTFFHETFLHPKFCSLKKAFLSLLAILWNSAFG